MGLGAIWLAHLGMDRLLGYGFKLPTGFKDTHLGQIGRNKEPEKLLGKNFRKN